MVLAALAPASAFAVAPIAYDDSRETQTDTPLGISLSAYDEEFDPLTYAIVTPPTNGILDDCSLGACTYTPDPGYVGADSFTWQANDGEFDSNVATFSITVMANTPPIAYDDSRETQTDTPLGISLSAYDEEFDPLTYAIVTPPTNGILDDCSLGACTYTPDPGYVGADSFTWQANDGEFDSNVATFSITVMANTPPIAYDDSRETLVDTDLYLSLLADDADPLTYAIVTPPTNGILDDCSLGACTYTPDPGYVGADSFTWQANDGEFDSNVATFSITVMAAPVAITSTGPLTRIETSPSLNCSVNHVADSAPEFFGTTACGTLLVVDGTLYGPAQIPAGDGASPRTPWTFVSQVPATGAGTNADPKTIVTVVDAGTTGIRVTQTDSYVDGSESYRTTIAITDLSGSQHDLRLYRAGDCYLQNSDLGFGILDPATGAVSCRSGVDGEGGTIPGPRVIQWFPLSAGSHAYEAGYSEVWSLIGSQGSFPDTCECDSFQDNGAGLSWDIALPANGSTTRVHLTTFSPLGRVPLVASKTADSGTTDVGGTNGYTITISNPNADGASLASITDTLPSGFAYLPGTTTGATTSDPTIVGDVLTWDGPFAVGAQSAATIQFDVTVSSTSGTYHNEATADGGVDAVVATGPTAPIDVVEAANTPPLAFDGAGQTAIDAPLPIILVASDADDDPLTYSIVDPPLNGALSDCDFSVGTCTYTPNLGYSGPDSFTWKANDGQADSNVATVLITVESAVNTAPTAVDDAYTVAEASQTELGVIGNDTDPESDPLMITAAQNPSAQGASVDCSGGFTCLYAPPLGFTGPDTFTYTVSDGEYTDTATVTITVEPCPDLTGALGDTGIVTGQQWIACSSTTAHAARGSNLTPLFAPTGPTLALMTSGDAALADGPNDETGAGRNNDTQLRGANDVSILRLNVSVPEATDCLAFSVMFASEEYPEFVGSSYNDAFIAELDTSSWSVSGSAITAPANFAFDLAGDVISINSSFFDANRVEVDTGMQYDGATALLQAQTPITPGAHSLYLSIFDASDGILDSAVLIDDLRAYAAGDAGCTQGAGQPPVAVDDAATTDEDVPVNVAVLGNDSDADLDTLTVIAVSDPANGSVVIELNGTVTYTPNLDFSGEDSFTYTITDGRGGTAQATVTITVLPVNDPPVVAAGDDAASTEGSSVALAGSVTDSDDTPTLLWTALGTGTDAGASCTFGTPAAAVTTVSCTDDGPWTLTLTADDGTNPPVADSLVLTLANADPVVGAGADQAATVGDTVSLDPATFSDAGANDTHTASVDWGDGTAGAGTVGAGTVSGSHAYGAPGTYTVTVTVTDDDGGIGSDTLVVTVSAVPNDPPVVAAGDDAASTEGSSVALAGSVTDSDDTPTLLWTALGTGTDAGASCTFGTPAAAVTTVSCTDDGPWTLTLTADDGTNPPVADSLVLTLANADPVVGAGADQAATVGDTVSLDPATFSDAGANDTHTASVDWGDGTAGAGTVGAGTVSGSHAYGAPGTYTVTVTVTDDDGGIGSDTLVVTVSAVPNDPPVVAAGDDAASTEGSSVALAGSVTDSDDTPTLLWTALGTGTDAGASCTFGTPAAAVTTVSCTDDGPWTLTLTADDGTNPPVADSLVLTLANADPVVGAGADQAATVGDTVSLDPATFSDAGANDTHTASVDWGDGTAGAGTVGAGTVSGSHAYGAPGTYTVTVTVTDDDGGIGSDTLVVTVSAVPNDPPVVAAGDDAASTEGSSVALAGSVTDSDDTPTLLWTALGTGTDAGASCTFGTPAAAVTTVSCTDDGPWTLTLTADDGTNPPVADSLVLTLANADPVVGAGADQAATVGDTVSLDPATFSDAGANDTHTASVDWGDGTAGAGTVGAGTVSGSHAYGAPGTYTVTVTVTDDDGGIGSDTLVVTVSAVPNDPPVVAAGDDAASTEGSSVALAGSVTDSDDTPTLLWTALGTGTDAGASCTFGTPAAAVTTVSCTDDGPWTLTLTADDGTNPPVADSLVLTLANADPVVGAGADQAATVGDTVSLDPATFSDAGANDTHTASVDWGDGTAGAGTVGAGTVSGSHAYGAPGTYTVTVTVTDDDGGIGSDTLVVTVSAVPNDPPVVAAGDDAASTEGSSVALAGSVTDSDDTPTLLWTALGTGTDAGASCTFGTPAAAVTTVSCTDDGPWTLTLTADDGTNPPVADSLVLTLANADPVVGAGADQAATVGDTVSLDPATFSDAGANDTHTASVDWGDGTAGAGTVGAGTVSGSHAYGAPGTYTVTVTVTDDDGGIGSDTLVVTVSAVPNDPPVVAAGDDAASTEGSSVALAGSVTDSDDTPTLLWTALGTGTDAGASCTFGTPAAAVTTVSCTDDGPWTLTLTADDGTNPPVADSLVLTLANADPVVGAGADQAATVGDTVSLDPATFSDAGANDTHTASVDWGDGTAGAGTVGAGTVSGSHAYGAPGTYTVTVTVTDDDGGIGSDTLVVTVSSIEEPPSADVGVTIVDIPDPVSSGSDVKYTLHVRNDGPDTATNVVVVDDLPAGTAFKSADPSQGTCSRVGGTLTCTLGDLSNGSTAMIAIVVTAPSVTSPATITNSATVTADEDDPAPGNNAASETTTVTAPQTDPDEASAWITAAGGRVETGGGNGPTKKDQMTTAVTVPAGYEGEVIISEVAINDCPAGYECFGQQANITAPTTSPANPLRFVFLFHPSSLPGGTKPDDVVMFHDNVLVPRCTAPSGVADPDPCILSVTKVQGRIRVEVLSSENGSWKGGV